MAWAIFLNLPPSFQHQCAICQWETNLTEPYSSRTCVDWWRWIHDNGLSIYKINKIQWMLETLEKLLKYIATITIMHLDCVSGHKLFLPHNFNHVHPSWWREDNEKKLLIHWFVVSTFSPYAPINGQAKTANIRCGNWPLRQKTFQATAIKRCVKRAPLFLPRKHFNKRTQLIASAIYEFGSISFIFKLFELIYSLLKRNRLKVISIALLLFMRDVKIQSETIKQKNCK